MSVVYYLSATATLVATVVAGVLIRKKTPTKLDTLFKTLSLLLATLLFFRYMTGDDNIFNIKNMQLGFGFTSKFMIVLALVQVWLMYTAEMLVILASFFKLKVMPTFVAFLGTISFALNFVFLHNHVIAIVGESALQGFSFRALLLAMESGVGLGYCLIHVFTNKDKIILHGKDWVGFAFSVAGMIMASTPYYVLQVLFNVNRFGMTVLDFNIFHRIVLYPAFIIPITLYVVLKNQSFETRKFALMYYAWSGLLCFSFSYRFADFFGSNWVTSWPLHLCNTAMYITPLCLTFNWKKFFYFTYFINVLGALLAMLMPNYDSAKILSWNLIQFYANHYQAFFMPLLVVGLGVFRRPRWKEFSYSLVAFGIYFFLMLILNAWFSNYDASVDYFFLNSDFIADKLGAWAENTRKIVLEFDIGTLHFKLYPLYQSLFLIVYYAMAFGVWFVYELVYNVVHGWEDIAIRSKKIQADMLALQAQLDGRSIEEPIDMESTNKLVLKNFTKLYGHSDVYAVKDANLEVAGGEIFGFLGPNGAGKSTIIKSIVGIQTITDGSITVCGYDVATQSVQAKRQIGFVPDHYALYERLTAREYINYIADLYGVSQQDRDERLANFIKLFEFETAIDNPIRTYSHGMKQKVTIMSALIHNPKVWILDEPLTGLDPNSIYQVKECMKHHAQQGNIVFFSSHIIDVVERICDKIAIIRKGQIQCVKDVHQMEADGESLEQFYMQTINGFEVHPIQVDQGKNKVATQVTKG